MLKFETLYTITGPSRHEPFLSCQELHKTYIVVVLFYMVSPLSISFSESINVKFYW